MSLARNHPHPDLLATAGVIRGQVHALVPCCAIHACEVALITAFSFAADVGKDDPVEMQRLITALSAHVARAIERGQIKFARPTFSVTLPNQQTRGEIPLHATVKWSYRSTSDSEYARHYDTPYVVDVHDQDGDRAVWSVALNGVVIADGKVEERDTKRCAMDIAMDTALAAMHAMQAEPSEDDH